MLLPSRDIGYNPVDGAQLPKQENMAIQPKEIEILSRRFSKSLKKRSIASIQAGEPRYWYASAYVLIANTGLRSGEALGLTWDKINYKTKTLTVSQNASRIKKTVMASMHMEVNKLSFLRKPVLGTRQFPER